LFLLKIDEDAAKAFVTNSAVETEKGSGLYKLPTRISRWLNNSLECHTSRKPRISDTKLKE
jgi:hypothetical protein